MPTERCEPHGHYLSSPNGTCIPCEEDSFNGNGNGVCETCPRGQTNVGRGNKACDKFVSDVNIAIPIVASGVYCLLTFSSFVFYVLYGGDWKALFTILIMLGDQVTDITFAAVGKFEHWVLMYMSGLFCIMPFLPIMVLLSKRTNWKCIALLHWTKVWLKRLDDLDDEEKGASGWSFVHVSGMRFNFLPNIFLISAGTLLWPVIRVLSVLIVILSLAVFQVLLFVLGLMLYITKLNGYQRVNDRFMAMWQVVVLKETETDVQSGEELDTVVLKDQVNIVILCEIACECLPQAAIQFVNGYMLYGWNWPLLPTLSLLFSLLMIFTVLYHFWFYMYMRGLPFADVPKVDLMHEALHEAVGIDSYTKAETDIAFDAVSKMDVCEADIELCDVGSDMDIDEADIEACDKNFVDKDGYQVVVTESETVAQL